MKNDKTLLRFWAGATRVTLEEETVVLGKMFGLQEVRIPINKIEDFSSRNFKGARYARLHTQAGLGTILLPFTYGGYLKLIKLLEYVFEKNNRRDLKTHKEKLIRYAKSDRTTDRITFWFIFLTILLGLIRNYLYK